jgi:predicted nucleotidyltransferase
MDPSEITRRAALVLDRYPAVRLAYLFGSQATGEAGPLSDVDLGVLLEGNLRLRGEDDFEHQARIAHELGLALQPLRVDLVSLQRAPIELAYNVIAQGICIYARSSAERVEYEAGVLSRYGDYLPVLRAQRREILEGGGDEQRVQRYREALERVERALGEIRAAKK